LSATCRWATYLLTAYYAFVVVAVVAWTSAAAAAADPHTASSFAQVVVGVEVEGQSACDSVATGTSVDCLFASTLNLKAMYSLIVGTAASEVGWRVAATASEAVWPELVVAVASSVSEQVEQVERVTVQLEPEVLAWFDLTEEWVVVLVGWIQMRHHQFGH
jgi:hypothetical protein